MAAVSKHRCSFIRSALMSYTRPVEGLFVLSLNHHIEDFNDLDHGKWSGGGLRRWLEEECVRGTVGGKS